MKKLGQTQDADGRILRKGDIVAPIRDNMRARICEIAEEYDEDFVQLRPVHQPYGRAIWHSAAHVVWVASGKPVPGKNAKPKTGRPKK